MSIKLSGVTLGNITGGPSSLNLYDLADVSIVAPLTGQYLRYNAAISEWQNAYIDTEVYNFLDTNLTGSNGVVLTKVSGPQTVDIGLAITASGDATGSLTAGNLALTLATVNANAGTFGSSTHIPVITANGKGLITAISQTAFTGTAPLATSLAGGTTGDLPYQSAAGVTSFLGAGTTSQVLVGSPTAPSWSNTPTLTGTNFTGIPNVALTNSSVTIGSTNIALGATSTTLAGLTSITSAAFVGPISGNASTATALATGRTFSLSTDATGTSASFDGTSNATIPVTLATVNASPQTDTFSKITVNGKGLTTATSAVVAGDITTALGYTPVNIAGDTMTGLLILSADPTAALGAVTKQYVDTVAAGLNVHASSTTATTATLATSSAGTVTYNNGAAGVGATLTTTGSFATIGGYSTADGDRILVKNEATQANNGIYVRTSATVLTRASDFDNSPTGEISAGDFTFVVSGTLAGTNWAQVTPAPITVGTTSIVFSQLSGPGVYVAGTGIDITTNVISNIGVTSAVAGTGIGVSGATGNVTISNLGVTSLTGTALQVAVSASTGAVTLSLPSSVTIGGTMTASSFVGTLTGSASLNVLKAGDTMTGNLTLTSTAFLAGASGEFIAGQDGSGFYFANGAGVNPAIPIYLGNSGTTTTTLRGNVIIPAPASGATLSVTGVGTAAAITVPGSAANGKTAFSGSGIDISYGNWWTAGSSEIATPNNLLIGSTGANSIVLFAGNLARLTIASSGAATFSSSVDAVSFNATSTKRVKKAIKNITTSYLDKFADLRPREYDRRDYDAHEFGFIAEEMVLVYPEVVGRDERGIPSGIDYGKLSTILTAKVQEQQKIINKLSDQVAMIMELLQRSK